MELLVVIAIIALLMSILMPAMSRVRRQTKAAICQSNLKQLGTCFAMYTGDNDGYFQEGYHGLPNCSWGGDGAHWWIDALKPYYKNNDVCLCPMASRFSETMHPGAIGAKFYAWFSKGWITKDRYGSYGVNGWVENNQCSEEEGTDAEAWRWRHANVKGGGNIPLLLDNQWIDGWPEDEDVPPKYDDQDYRFDPTTHMDRFMMNRHDGYINGVFVDFTVRRIGLKELYTLKWHRAYDVRGTWTLAGNVSRDMWPEWLQKFKDY